MESTPPTIVPELLEVRQAAQFLNIGRNRVYEMAKSNQLPVIYFGSTLRFSRQALYRWIEQQLQEVQ